MLNREPSIFARCPSGSDQAQSGLTAESTQTSDEEAWSNIRPVSGLLKLETKCKVLSLRKINTNFSDVKVAERDPVKRMEKKVEEMEENFIKSKKYYLRKLGRLNKMLMKEEHKQRELEEEMILSKIELTRNLKLMEDLFTLLTKKKQTPFVDSQPKRSKKKIESRVVYRSPPKPRTNRIRACNNKDQIESGSTYSRLA